MVALPSVEVALKVRQSGSESPCRWLRRDGVYMSNIEYTVMLLDYLTDGF